MKRKKRIISVNSFEMNCLPTANSTTAIQVFMISIYYPNKMTQLRLSIVYSGATSATWKMKRITIFIQKILRTTFAIHN